MTDTYNEAFATLNKENHSQEAQAFKRFEQLGIPTRKSEVYKYSNLAHFKKLRPSTTSLIPHKLPDFFKHEYMADKHVLVTVNGIYAENLSTIHPQEGLHIACMCDARRDFRDVVEAKYNKTSGDNPDNFAEMNTAFSQCGIFIYAQKNIIAEKPILILHLGYGQEEATLACQRNLIVLESSSQVEIVEDYVNLDENTAFNINHFSEYYVDQNAHVKVGIYQEESNELYFIGNKFFELEKDSTMKVDAINLDGQFVRNNFRVNLNDQNIEATINGVFINERNVHTDSRILINHNAPNCVSNQNFKGILTDQSTAIFNGKVYVAEGAQQTNAYQSNKNVLLSEEATINTKPELEIYADDVKCSHGATSGQLDENAIFYLQSRGIPREKAKSLIVFATAQEVIQDISNEDLRNFLERRLVRKLDLTEYSTVMND